MSENPRAGLSDIVGSSGIWLHFQECTGCSESLCAPSTARLADVAIRGVWPRLVQPSRDALSRVMPEPRMIAVSARTGEGIAEWLTWLEARRPRAAAGAPHAHAHGSP